MSEASRRRDIGEAKTSAVAIHDVGHEPFVLRVAGPQVEVEKAVVVEVSEVGPHRHRHLREVLAHGDVLEGALPIAAIQASKQRMRRVSDVARRDVLQTVLVRGYIEIESSVVVEIPEPDRKAELGAFDAELDYKA